MVFLERVELRQAKKRLCFMLETCLLQGLQWARKPSSLHLLLGRRLRCSKTWDASHLPSPSSQLEESQDGEGAPCPIPLLSSHTPLTPGSLTRLVYVQFQRARLQ